MGKDFTLNFNDLVHKTGELEAVLEPTLRYNAELEKELEREKAKLEQDQKDLAVLQKNAKSQAGLRAETLRTVRNFGRPITASVVLTCVFSYRRLCGHRLKAPSTLMPIVSACPHPICRTLRRTSRPQIRQCVSSPRNLPHTSTKWSPTPMHWETYLSASNSHVG
jgi:uncharacterized membrane-anchored protein YhcB (DUF1043 family)